MKRFLELFLLKQFTKFSGFPVVTLPSVFVSCRGTGKPGPGVQQRCGRTYFTNSSFAFFDLQTERRRLPNFVSTSAVTLETVSGFLPGREAKA